MSSRTLVIVPLAAGLLAGFACDDMLLHRAGADYFPLVTGSEWTYVVGTDTAYRVEVVGDTSVGQQTSIAVHNNFQPEFWLKQPTRISKFFYRDTLIGEYPDTIEQRYGLYYLLPLVEGNAWADSFADTVFGTDTFSYVHLLSARISGIETADTPAGEFDNCYRLDFTEEFRTSDTTSRVFSEWLAPGVGVVRREVNGELQLLAGYRIGPADE